MDPLFSNTEGSPDLDSPNYQPNTPSIHSENNGNCAPIRINNLLQDQGEPMDIEASKVLEYSHHTFGETLSNISEVI